MTVLRITQQNSPLENVNEMTETWHTLPCVFAC